MDQKDLSALQREVGTLLISKDCPYISKYFQLYEDDYKFYILMELCKGGKLSQAMGTERRVDEITCSKYMQQIAKALQYCHERNIVHRDIKPDNIMLGHNQQIKLIDFGLAIRHNPGKKKESAGTPFYMAPEVYTSEYDTKADIWAMGVTMQNLLTNTYPFKGQERIDGKNIVSAAEDLQKKVTISEPNIPRIISHHATNLIRKMLEKDPKKRLTAK